MKNLQVHPFALLGSLTDRFGKSLSSVPLHPHVFVVPVSRLVTASLLGAGATMSVSSQRQASSVR